MKLFKSDRLCRVIVVCTMIILFAASMIIQFHHHDSYGHIHFGNNCCEDVNHHEHDEDDVPCGMHLDFYDSNVVSSNHNFSFDYRYYIHYIYNLVWINQIGLVVLSCILSGYILLCVYCVLGNLHTQYAVCRAFRGPPSAQF